VKADIRFERDEGRLGLLIEAIGRRDFDCIDAIVDRPITNRPAIAADLNAFGVAREQRVSQSIRKSFVFIGTDTDDEFLVQVPLDSNQKDVNPYAIVSLDIPFPLDPHGLSLQSINSGDKNIISCADRNRIRLIMSRIAQIDRDGVDNLLDVPLSGRHRELFWRAVLEYNNTHLFGEPPAHIQNWIEAYGSIETGYYPTVDVPLFTKGGEPSEVHIGMWVRATSLPHHMGIETVRVR
jgi:hypothetical protein